MTPIKNRQRQRRDAGLSATAAEAPPLVEMTEFAMGGGEQATATARATAKYRGLSATAAEAPPLVEVTEFAIGGGEQATTTARATAKYRGLSATAAEAPPLVEVTCGGGWS